MIYKNIEIEEIENGLRKMTGHIQEWLWAKS